MKQKNVVLMVVAVGCGLVAAFLTSQMSAKTAQIETVEVIVAAKDLPVGSLVTKDEAPKLLKRKKVPKDGVQPGIIESEEELLDKRLTRAVRAEETINKGDLTKGGVVTIPVGQHLITLQLDITRAAGGFAGPGSRVDVLTFVRLDNKVNSMPILVNMLILAVDGQTTFPKEGVFQSVNTVSFAADRKQGLVLELAKARGCQMSLLLRHPNEVTDHDQSYDIDRVVKLLQDDRNPVTLEGTGDGDNSVRAKTDPKGEGPKTVEAPTPAVKQEMVKIPYAKVDIKAGTEITKDLIADAEVFGIRELPKELVEDAVADLAPFVGQVFRSGLGKGQWVTRSLVGTAEPKAPPRDPDVLPKDSAPTPPEPRVQGPAATPKRTHDVTIHTASDVKVYRYEEVEPGRWRFLYEVRPTGKPTPAAAAESEKKVD